MDFDAIVIGSGFGGSVTACRLAEAGYRVVVLERGRRWDKASYPREPTDDWWWSQAHPARWNGWLDLRVFRHMVVAQGAAVGGGSLIYANISAVPHPELFAAGWPPEITWEAMAPFYRTVGEVMNVQRVPDGQWPKRMQLMKEAADAIGEGGRFQKLELAVSFDRAWNYDLPDAIDPRHSKRFVNAQGVEQGTCVHLGNCDIGCDVDARNTLDRNYLALAERHGADVRPLHLATAIEPVDGGYRVHFAKLDGGREQTDTLTARFVIVAAGSLNSTELLLRCRDVSRTLPRLSRFLGRNWSSNGDFLTPAIYGGRRLNPSEGPPITSAIDFLDRSQDDRSFWIEDGGFPNIVGNWIRTGEAAHPEVRAFLELIRGAVERHGPIEHVMPWFAQGVDAADGHLRLRRRWWLFGAWELVLDWQIEESRRVIDAIIVMHRRLSDATGGHPLVPPSWSIAEYLITPHPLGGCNMGTGPETGVVDHQGEVFGYRNLFVIDGAIVPEALGVNPSRTIAALAERAAGLIAAAGR
jgi:cholesterol oxidase